MKDFLTIAETISLREWLEAGTLAALGTALLFAVLLIA